MVYGLDVLKDSKDRENDPEFNKLSTAGTGGEVISKDDMPTIVAPEMKVTSGKQVKNIWDRILRNNAEQWENDKMAYGLIKNNPPFSEEELRERNLQDTISNVNLGDARAMFRAQGMKYWRLIHDSEFIIDCTLEGVGGNPSMLTEWGRAIARRTDRLWRNWAPFGNLISVHQKELLAYGNNIIFWKNPQDWRFEVIDRYSWGTRTKTPNVCSEFSSVAIKHSISIDKIWEYYQRAKATGKSGKGWSADALGELIYLTKRDTQTENNDVTSWMRNIETKVSCGDISPYADWSDEIDVVTVLVKEYPSSSNGYMPKISWVMAPLDTVLSLDNGLIYKYKNKYEYMEEAIFYFSLMPGEQYVEDTAGFAHEIFTPCSALARLDNSLIDQAVRSATLFLQTTPGIGEAEEIMFDMGGICNVGNAQIVQNLLGANIGAVAAIANQMKLKVFENNNMSGFTQGNDVAGQNSVEEVRYKATREALTQKNTINHYKGQADKFYSELFRKTLFSLKNKHDLETARWMEQLVYEDGVPVEIFGDIDIDKKKIVALNSTEQTNKLMEYSIFIKTQVAGGSGSQIADQIEMSTLINILSALPGSKSQQNLLEDYITAMRGWQYSKRYMVEEELTNKPSGQTSVASLENFVMEMGGSAIVGTDNDHIVHTNLHLEHAKQVFELLQNGQYELEKAGTFFGAAVQHIGAHYQEASQRKGLENVAKQIGEILKVVNEMAGPIVQAIEQNQAAQEQADATQKVIDNPQEDLVRRKQDLEHQREMERIHLHDEALMAEKDKKDQRTAQKQATAGAIMQQKTQNAIELSNRKADADIANKTRKSIVDAAVKMQNANSKGGKVSFQDRVSKNGNLSQREDI